MVGFERVKLEGVHKEPLLQVVAGGMCSGWAFLQARHRWHVPTASGGMHPLSSAKAAASWVHATGLARRLRGTGAAVNGAGC